MSKCSAMSVFEPPKPQYCQVKYGLETAHCLASGKESFIAKSGKYSEVVFIWKELHSILCLAAVTWLSLFVCSMQRWGLLCARAADAECVVCSMFHLHFKSC